MKAPKKTIVANWIVTVAPLMRHLREIGARMTWEGYASLDLDHPQKKDVIIQHWLIPDGPKTRYYLVQIWADGNGWNVFQPVTDNNDIQATLDAIK